MQENGVKLYNFHNTKILLIRSNNFNVEKIEKKLSIIEKMKLSQINTEKRKKDFLYIRYLKSFFFKGKNIYYNDNGAPYFKNSIYNISISHSKDLYGFAFCKNHVIGLDIEFIRPNINKIKHKFCSELESEIFNTEKKLTQLWTIKEVLYKISNLKELSFINNLHCNKINNETTQGFIKTSNKIIQAEITTFEFDEFLISINTSFRNEI